MFPDAGDKLETTEIESLNSDFTLALQGVGAVIHCAAPLTPQFTGKEIVDVSLSFIHNLPPGSSLSLGFSI